MPEHGPVPPRTRRGASSRPLAAAVSIALALLGTTVLALPASADDAPPDPSVAIAPAVEPSASPSPEASEPAPSPTPSATPSDPPADLSTPPTLGGDTAPMLAAAGAPTLFAAAAPAAASPILGPTTITGNVGAAIDPAEYTAPGLGTPKLRGSLPWQLDDTSQPWRGALVIDGVARTAGTFTVQVFTGSSWSRRTASIDVTITIVSPATISGDDEPWGERSTYFREDYTLGGSPLPTASGVTFSTPLPAGLSFSVSGSRLRIEGTPTTTGRFSTTVTASNTHGSATLPLTITIYGVDVAPVPDLYLARGVAMTPVVVPVDAYPTDIDWDATLPAGLDVRRVSGGLEIFGTPTRNGTSTARISVETRNGWYSDQAAFTIAVGNPPTVPALVPRTVLADEAMRVIRIDPSGAMSLTTAAPLPDGLVLTAAGTGWRLSGTPSRTTMGEHTITFNATNAYGTTSTTLRLTVQATPAITVSDQTFTAGGDATHTVTATGWPLPLLSASGLPAGLTADGSAKGTLVITGSTTVLGTSTITVSAANGTGPAAVQATYALSIVKAPVFAEDSMALTVDAGEPMTPVALDAESYPPHTVALAPGSAPLPAGLTLDATTGTLAGTPTAGAAGVHTLTVRATNAYGYDDMTVDVTVRAAPDIASTSGSRTFQLDQASSFAFTTSGWPAPAVSMAGLPDGLALEQVDATTWRVSGTVSDPDELGPHAVRVTLTNSLASVSRTMTVRVEGFAWLEAPGDLVVEAGVPISPFVVSARAFGQGSYLGYIDPSPHPWITCGLAWVPGTDTRPNQDTWTCTGTPPAVGETPLTFVVRFTPPVPSRTIGITVVERPVIDAPDSTVVADDDVSLPVTVTADPAPTSVVATGLPTGLSLEPTADGSWAIVGRVDRSAVGVYPVTITADNGLVGEHSLTLTVGTRPALPAGDAAITLDEPFTATVTADGSPTPTVVMTDGDLPPGLTWSATGAVGTLEGTPTEPGVWTYTVTATNGHGTAEQTYRIEVQQAATFADDTLSLTMIEGVADSRTLPLSGFPLPTVTPTGSIPDGITVEYTPGTAPVLAGTPAPGSAGTYTLVLTAGNHTVLGDTTDTVTIEVTVLAAATLAGTDPLVSTVGTVVDRPLVVGGAPAPTVTATGLPTGVELAQDPGGQWHLVGTPAPGTGGRHEVTLTADNGVLSPATATMTVTVREPVAEVVVPVANLRVGTPAVVTVRAQGGWPAPAALSVEGTLPSGLRFVDQGDGTGQVVGTPAAGTTGSWQVTIVGDNGVGTARATLTLTVTAPAATAPVRAPAPAAAPADPSGGTPAPDDADESGPDPGTGDGDGAGGQDATGSDDTEAAPPVLDPEETITVEGSSRPWWWILGAAFVGALLIGLRALERKLRSL